jgi:cytochrome b
MNEKRLIWDLPTRVFHWGFAGSVLAALALAKVAPEESPLFYAHIVFGVAAGLLLLWRIVWGFSGSHHARFGALIFSPAETIGYFKSVLSGKGQYHAGHNPGGALSVWALLILVGVAVFSGFGMSFWGDAFEEVHEVSTNLVMIVAAIHVLGVIMATVMNKENYAGAMFSGRKRAEAKDAISSPNTVTAFLMAALVLAGVFYFVRGFDFADGTFQAPGTTLTLRLGGHEKEHHGHDHGHEGHDDKDSDGDDD